MERKQQGRPGAGGRKRKATAARGRTRTSITWDNATLRRLDVHCAAIGRERYEVLAELVERHLTRFVLSDRGGPGRDREEGTQSGEEISGEGEQGGKLGIVA